MKTNNKKTVCLFLLLSVILPLAMVKRVGQILALPLTPPITPPITGPITPTPTAIPTPTITPRPNRNPEIYAQKKYQTQVGKYFYDIVKVIDRDGDKLNVAIYNLPRGISYRCFNARGWSYCVVSGVAKFPGINPIGIRAYDYRGGFAYQSSLFIVKKDNQK